MQPRWVWGPLRTLQTAPSCAPPQPMGLILKWCGLGGTREVAWDLQPPRMEMCWRRACPSFGQLKVHATARRGRSPACMAGQPPAQLGVRHWTCSSFAPFLVLGPPAGSTSGCRAEGCRAGVPATRVQCSLTRPCPLAPQGSPQPSGALSLSLWGPLTSSPTASAAQTPEGSEGFPVGFPAAEGHVLALWRSRFAGGSPAWAPQTPPLCSGVPAAWGAGVHSPPCPVWPQPAFLPACPAPPRPTPLLSQDLCWGCRCCVCGTWR